MLHMWVSRSRARSQVSWSVHAGDLRIRHRSSSHIKKQLIRTQPNQLQAQGSPPALLGFEGIRKLPARSRSDGTVSSRQVGVGRPPLSVGSQQSAQRGGRGGSSGGVRPPQPGESVNDSPFHNAASARSTAAVTQASAFTSPFAGDGRQQFAAEYARYMTEKTQLQRTAAADMAMLRQHGGLHSPRQRAHPGAALSEPSRALGGEVPRFPSETFSRDSRDSIETMTPPLVERQEWRSQWRMAASSRAMSLAPGESLPEAGSVRGASSTLTAEVLERVEREHPSLSAGWAPPAVVTAAADFDATSPQRAGRWVAQPRTGSAPQQGSSWGSTAAADKHTRSSDPWTRSPLLRSSTAPASALQPSRIMPGSPSSSSQQLPRAPAGSMTGWAVGPDAGAAAGTAAGPATGRSVAGPAEHREYDRHPWLLWYLDAATERRFHKWQAWSVLRTVRPLFACTCWAKQACGVIVMHGFQDHARAL